MNSGHGSVCRYKRMLTGEVLCGASGKRYEV